jgi:hypothetical protein
LHYRISPIPTASDLGELRADLLAEHEDDVLIVEAKAKAEHSAFLEHMVRLRESGTSVLERPLAPWNALSSMVEKAARQLEATPAPSHAVRILWASCLHGDWQFVLEALQRRLFGQVPLTRFKRTGGLPEMLEPQECFYYGPADFLRYRSIDGTILACPQGVRLLVNEFGERVAQLRSTHLHREMSRHGLVTDPVEVEGTGHAMAIRRALPARNPKARWQYLVDTYGVMTAPVVETNFRSDLAIPASAFTSEDGEP